MVSPWRGWERTRLKLSVSRLQFWWVELKLKGTIFSTMHTICSHGTNVVTNIKLLLEQVLF